MNKICKLLVVLLVCLAFTCTAFAHSGRTDSSGGHHDYKNVSGLGSYHYHHGYSAHLHKNGVCPYAISTDTTSNNYKSSVSNTKKVNSTNTYTKPVEKTQLTDIKAYINEFYIPSVNYKDHQYIVAEDLSNYGYDVVWNNDERTLKISKNIAKPFTATATSSNEQYEIQSSDIKTYILNKDTNSYNKIDSYNIGGRTIIKLSDLGSVSWDNSTRTTKLEY